MIVTALERRARELKLTVRNCDRSTFVQLAPVLHLRDGESGGRDAITDSALGCLCRRRISVGRRHHARAVSSCMLARRLEASRRGRDALSGNRQNSRFDALLDDQSDGLLIFFDNANWGAAHIPPVNSSPGDMS